MTALMVVGFMIWWPLGLATLAYIIWGDRLGDVKHEVNRVANSALGDAFRRTSAPSARSGNVAFDDWRRAEIERLDEERKKLDEVRADFDAYIVELHRARDRDEFTRFMDNRKNAKKVRKATSVDGASELA